jgi:hypothetical protein
LFIISKAHISPPFPLIKLFGNACTLYAINSSTIARLNLFAQAEAMGVSLQEGILDVNFFSFLNYPVYPNLQSISDSMTSGLILDAKSRIELHLATRRKRIIQINDLLFQSTLFRLYNIQFNTFKLPTQGICVIEKETSLFASFSFPSLPFDVTQLQFSLTTLEIHVEKLTLLSGISYNQKPLKHVKSDTVLTANYAFFLP